MIYRNRVNVGTTINTLPYVIPAYIPYITPGTTGNLLTSDGSNWITGIPSATKYQLQGLGVGTAASTITGEIRATNNVTAYYSDARLKKVISNIKNPLDAVRQLNGVIYKGNDTARKYGYTTDEEQVGVLAQEVQKVLPQVVTPAPFDIAQAADGSEYSKSGENYMTVRYERLIPLLIEAIKELEARVTELQNSK